MGQSSGWKDLEQNYVSRMILNVDASVFVQSPALAFVGFEWVRETLLDHTCVRHVLGIYLVQIVFLDCSSRGAGRCGLGAP
jgi:hypothetical protein